VFDDARVTGIRQRLSELERIALDGSALLGEQGFAGFELRRLSSVEVEVTVALNTILAEIDDLYVSCESGGLLDARQAVFDELFRRQLPDVIKPPWEPSDDRI